MGRAERCGTIFCFMLSCWGGDFASVTRAGGRAERCGTICCFILPRLGGGLTSHLSPVRGAERSGAVQFAASSFRAWGGGDFASVTRAGGRAERCGTICCFILPRLGGVTSHLSPVRGAERGVAVQFAASSIHAEGVASHLSPVRGAERGVAYLALTLCKWFALDRSGPVLCQY